MGVWMVLNRFGTCDVGLPVVYRHKPKFLRSKKDQKYKQSSFFLTAPPPNATKSCFELQKTPKIGTLEGEKS